MRGYQTRPAAAGAPAPAIPAAVAASNVDAELVSLLLSIRDELRRTQELLAARKDLPQ